MIKPRSEWDTEDLLDYLDGWHAECGVGFKVERDVDRRVSFLDPTAKPPDYSGMHRAQCESLHAAWTRDNTLTHVSGDFVKLGCEDRFAHREATGI